MTTLESAIAATLRAEAEEAAMTTDTPTEFEVLSSRLDDLDASQRRRRRTWLVAAAAAVVLAVVAAVVLRPTSAPVAPAQPDAGSGIVFRSLVFDRPFSLRLPAWYAEVGREATQESEQRVTFNRCPGDPVCIGLDVYAFTPTTAPGGGATRPGMMAAYDSLAASGALRLTDRLDREVGGLAATTFSVIVTRTVEDGLGCFDNGSCEGFYERDEARYAVVETPDGLVVVGMRTFADNPYADEWLAQFDQVLDGMRFGADREPAPSPAPRTELSGVWETTLTRPDIEQVLAAAGLSAYLDRALAELPRDRDRRWTVQLWVDATRLRASLITEDGVPDLVDTRFYSWDGSRLTLVTEDGAYRSVFEADRADGRLRLTPVSVTGAPVDGVPIEVFERMLYETAAFRRAD
jgi:hypothetical protein